MPLHGMYGPEGKQAQAMDQSYSTNMANTPTQNCKDQPFSVKCLVGYHC